MTGEETAAALRRFEERMEAQRAERDALQRAHERLCALLGLEPGRYRTAMAAAADEIERLRGPERCGS